jgi:MFS family permease
MATALLALAGLAASFVVISGRDPGAERPAATAGPRPAPDRREWAGLVLAGLAIAPFVGCFYAFLSFFPAHLAAFAWDPATKGLALGLLGWAPIVAAPLGGWIAAKTGRPTALAAVCMTGWGATVIAAGLTGPTPTLLALLLLLGPLPVGVMMSLPARVVAPERRGVASGVFMAFMFGGATAFPALAGWVGERFGDAALPPAATAVTFCGAAFLSALVPLLLLERIAGRRTQAA